MAAEVETLSMQFGNTIKNADTALSFCLCNKFTHAENFLKELDSNCMYHSISRATIAYLQAIFTYEQQLINIAYQKVKDASQLCDSMRRKQTFGEMVSSWVGSTSFDDFSEVELHAELCYAECLLERAMLTFIQDENLINFIKGGLKIRSAFSIYRNCMHALQQNPRNLISSKNKVHFESGVYMGMGSFNVLLSLLPPRVLRLLEWVGFSGNKRNGLNWLEKGFQIGGLRSPLCSITLLGYHVVVSPLLSLHDTDVNFVKRILNSELKKFPDSSIFLYFSGRLRQTQGLINEALLEYEKAVSTTIDWYQVHHICYWEMMWCYSFLGNWEQAAHYSEKLSNESKWSKCSYIYMNAAFLIMQQFELRHSGDAEKVKEADDMSENIDVLLKKVKSHKQRIAGKSIPFEKFATSRVDKYTSTGNLVLPGLEIIHIWNGFSMFSKHTKTLEHFLRLATIALQQLKEVPGQEKEHHDNVCLCLLLKGICLRHLNRTDEAVETLNSVASSPMTSHSSKMDSYFPPFASAEIGAIYHDSGDEEKAVQQYEHVLKNYTKYGLESRLHFRVHGGIESIKEKQGCHGNNSNTTMASENSDEDEFFDVEQNIDGANKDDDEFCDVGITLNGDDVEQNHGVGDKTNGSKNTDIDKSGVDSNGNCDTASLINVKLTHNSSSSSSEQSLTATCETAKNKKSSSRSPRLWFKKKSTSCSNLGDNDDNCNPSSPKTLSGHSASLSPLPTKTTN